MPKNCQTFYYSQSVTYYFLTKQSFYSDFHAQIKQPVEKVALASFGCHCWLVQQCISGNLLHSLLDKPAVAPF
ncbi:MAG: hypothetical protein JXM70_22600, partial [Pirellulales bacterium]|nr:hypothetical protein [Pirellulales bacterium]